MAKIPITQGFRAGWGIFKIAKLFLFGLFLFFLFFSIITQGIYKKDMNFIVKELGEEFLNPIKLASESSLDIQENGLGWNIFSFYFHLYKIYLWLLVFIIIIKWVFGDRTSPMERFFISSGIFLGLQFVYVTTQSGDANSLLIYFKNIFQGVIHIFTNFDFKSGKESFLQSNNTCTEGVCIY